MIFLLWVNPTGTTFFSFVVMVIRPSRSGAPSHVLQCILGDSSRVKELMASERNGTTAWMLQQWVSPAHIFADAAKMCSKKAFKTHAKQCKVPSISDLGLYLCGFSRQGNSRLNPDRLKKDPVSSERYDSFRAAKAYIAHSRPRVFVLENVEGLKMPRPGSDTGGSMLDHILSLDTKRQRPSVKHF